MKLITTALALAAFSLTGSAMAGEAHFWIEDVQYQGDCGGLQPIINTAAGDPSLDLIYGDLRVETDDIETKARKLCNARIKLHLEPGYKIGLDGVFFQGKVDIDSEGGSGNVSARAFFQGLEGLEGYRKFYAGESGNFTVYVQDGTPNYTQCGQDVVYLNLLVDLTARQKPGNGQYTEVAIQRGVATPTPSDDAPVIQCQFKPVYCH